MNNYYPPQRGRYVNKVIYLVLIFFLGAFGIHYFYAGKNVAGILCLLFCWTFIPTLIAIIVFIITLFRPADINGNIFIS